MSTLEDFRTPVVTGTRPLGFPLISRLLCRVHRATTRNRDVALHFLRVMHRVESPAILLRPDLLARLLLRGAPAAPTSHHAEPEIEPAPG